MSKRQTVASACNGRWRKRRSSAVRTLVAETLVLAKTHGYVEKIEDELERELQRDFSDPPEEKILRWRRQGDTVFKSKHMLLTVVILCIVDCALVLGELALDLYKVKATLEGSEKFVYATKSFLTEMKEQHPLIYDKNHVTIFSMILDSTVIWMTSSVNSSAYEVMTSVNNSDKNLTSYSYLPCMSQKLNFSTPILTQGSQNNSTLQPQSTSVPQTGDKIPVIGKIAHIFHYCSITILAVILLETVLKAICAGKSFFHRKIEVFDAFVVVMSFLMDFSFLVFLDDIDTTDFVFILAILLPWRVIRVVNSLIVSVKDHEHFRLKLVYKRKKKIQGNLRDTEALLQKYMAQVTNLQRLCIKEGIEEWKIDNHLKSLESIPPTPAKKKFKFKFEDTLLHNMQGFNRAARASLPSLDFHGLKLPNSVTRSKLSLPAVAHSIKQHISQKLPSRRASLAAADVYHTKIANGDVRRRKYASEDLCTMHEEELEHEENSALSSRCSSVSGDVFNQSISESIGSDRILIGGKRAGRKNSESFEDERAKLAKIQEEAKRRHSESTLDRHRVKFVDIDDIIPFSKPLRKSFRKVTEPATPPRGDSIEEHDSSSASDEDNTSDNVTLGESETGDNNSGSVSVGGTQSESSKSDSGNGSNTPEENDEDCRKSRLGVTPTVVFTLSKDELHFENETPNGDVKGKK